MLTQRLLPVLLLSASASLAPTTVSASNPIQIENARPGTTSWQLNNPATNREIEGYASLTSVNRGNLITFFVSTPSPTYSIDVYRTGWYGGAGGRLLFSAGPVSGAVQTAPAMDQRYGTFDCNWSPSYILSIPSAPDPSDWASGVYLAKLTASSGKQSYIIFVVRDDSRSSDYLFQSSVTTYQAYNNWPGTAAGGKSLYAYSSSSLLPAVKVSFNRPYAISSGPAGGIRPAAAKGVGAGEFLTNENSSDFTTAGGWEYNMVRFLEAEGSDVTYCTNIDTHQNGHSLLQHRSFLVVGHDEYWSREMRDNVEAARGAGINLGFFSSNACYWQVRLEASGGSPYRIMVGYKDGQDLFQCGSDDFVATTRNPNKWVVGAMAEGPPASQVSVTQGGGYLQVAPAPFTNGFSGYVAKEAWNFMGKTATIFVPQTTTQNINSYTFFAITADALNYYRVIETYNQLFFQRMNAGSRTGYSILYDSSQHRWWRIRHDASANVVVFETSLDGIAWTNQHQEPGSPWLTNTFTELQAGTLAGGIANPGQALFKNFSTDAACIDPVTDDRKTVTWSAPPVNRPEDSLIGVRFRLCTPVGAAPYRSADIVISNASSWVCSGTGLVNGSHLPYLEGCEADRSPRGSAYGEDNPISGLVVVAHSPVLTSTYCPTNVAYAEMTTYVHPSGATVFATGSMQWSWGLDNYDAAAGTAEARGLFANDNAKRMTRNVLARLSASPARFFYTLTPCRIVDTRGAAGPYGGPALNSGGDRTFALAGQCGIPSTAKAASLNVTVTAATNGPGHFTLYPGGYTLPTTSTLSYSAGRTRANNAIAPLGPAGGLTVRCDQGAGTAHIIVDVNGYFQ